MEMHCDFSSLIRTQIVGYAINIFTVNIIITFLDEQMISNLNFHFKLKRFIGSKIPSARCDTYPLLLMQTLCHTFYVLSYSSIIGTIG